jgi:mannose-1-phosphate guanylyltransferase
MRSVPDAIVLCGGAGTRLRTVTDGPKAMVSVGSRPFLELLLRQLRRWDIERVILAVGHQRDAIRNHFGHSAFGLQIVYSPELTPLGTGGALGNAAHLVSSSATLVLNGDSYTDADLHRFMSYHQDSGADMSMLLVPHDGREDCGTVSVDADGRLLDFQEKQPGTGPRYVNAGIYVLGRETLFDIPSGMQISLERELLPKWLAQGKPIRALVDPAACYDIGTPERYQNAEALLAAAETYGNPAIPGGER